MSLRVAILAGLTIFGIVLLGVWLVAPSVFAEARGLLDGERLETLVARAGLWGPVLIVTLMTVAVVASPIPSAPIALAAGAAYGHLWGTVQVVIGAELGALIAFGLARVLGYDVLRRVFGDRVDAGLLGSQTALTATVFASRLKKRLRQGAQLIVIDPRRIDLVKSPHVRAAHHLALTPGTNVAVVTALAHVIVTEGLMDEAFIRERCDWDEFQHYAEFVSEARHSPEAVALLTGVNAQELRAAARLFATGGNGAIYYGLGVTEHSQGSTTVMAIANLAMLTGNVGRPGVGVNPLRGQNNVQGSCDMGSFPHELPGYRHVKGPEVRDIFQQAWGVEIDPEPGLRIPNMLDAAVAGSFKGLYCQGEDILQSDPDTKHVAAGLAAMDCVIVHDLFLNETAHYAHVFLPGSSFLEKNGTFTNAERRINRVRKVMAPRNGFEDWEVTQLLANALLEGTGRPLWSYTHPEQIMAEIAATTPSDLMMSPLSSDTME